MEEEAKTHLNTMLENVQNMMTEAAKVAVAESEHAEEVRKKGKIRRFARIRTSSLLNRCNRHMPNFVCTCKPRGVRLQIRYKDRGRVDKNDRSGLFVGGTDVECCGTRERPCRCG